MSNTGFISIDPHLTVVETKIDTIDTVVDAIRAVDVPALTALISAIKTRGELKTTLLSTGAGDYIDIVSISPGTGKLLYIIVSATAASTTKVKIKVDTESFDEKQIPENNTKHINLETDALSQGLDLFDTPQLLNMEFNSLLLVRGCASGGGGGKFLVIYQED